MSEQTQGHGRKRPKGNRQRRDHAPFLPPAATSGVYSQPSAPVAPPYPTYTQNMAVEPMSFEAKIALALNGSNWQELQKSSSLSDTPVVDHAITQEAVAEDAIDVGDEYNRLPAMTAKQKKKKERFDTRVAQHAGEVLETIDVDSLLPVPQNVTWDQDPELLCCYNWQASSDGTNTIFVPGEPGKWRPPALPHTLEPDSGFQYADYNYARQPRSPYEPMFQALSLMNPNYQFMDVDVLADRNNLRVLLEFVQGKANGPFRLDLYSIFNTLVIVRNESKWWKFSNGESYGCNFERFFTQAAEGMEDATSHYRAIRYSMGPLSVVCRFEADAYDDGVESDELTAVEVQAVSGGLAQRPSFKYSAPIRVLQKGHIVPTAQMVELKTKAIKRDEEGRIVSQLVQCQDQLWFGRTSLLYTGPYESGTGLVSRVKYEDATERVKNWEAKNQDSLRKLVGLLTQLKAIMRRERRPNHSVIIVREDKAGPLSIRSMESSNRAIGKEAFDNHWRRAAPRFDGFARGGFRGHRAGGQGKYESSHGRGHTRNVQGEYQGSSRNRASLATQTSNGQGRGSQTRDPSFGRAGVPI